MKTIGEFWLNKKNISEQIYHVVKKKMTWYGGRTATPPDTPKCGFDNELCQEPPKFDGMPTFVTLGGGGGSYLDKKTLIQSVLNSDLW